MLNLKKIFAVALIFAVVFAALPLSLLNTQSDIVQITQEIMIGEKSANPEATGKAKPKSPDYKISINRAKTDIPIVLAVYTLNDDGLSSTFVTGAITLAAQEWDKYTTANLLSDFNNPVVAGIKGAIVSLNGENAVFFADYSDSNVIAMASYWYNRVTKEIVECDIMFNTDFQWGNAVAYPSLMDLQNIATHELGHFFNLADIYDTSKDYLTMYGYSWEGDIQKRDLAAGDIAGIQAVFGK
jgi:hypothetical protein